MLEVIAVVHSTCISSVKLGDIKLDKLDLTTIIHTTSFTVITCDFFSSCWVGWEFTDLYSWGVMNFQFSMSDILLQSLMLKKEEFMMLYVAKCLAYKPLFASVICPGLPIRTWAMSFLSKLLVSVQMPMMVLWASYWTLIYQRIHQMGNKSGIVFSSCVEGNTGQMVSFSAFRTSILGFLHFSRIFKDL